MISRSPLTFAVEGGVIPRSISAALVAAFCLPDLLRPWVGSFAGLEVLIVAKRGSGLEDKLFNREGVGQGQYNNNEFTGRRCDHREG